MLDNDTNKLDRTGAQKPTCRMSREFAILMYSDSDLPCSCIRKLTVNRVKHCSQQNTVLQTDVDEGSRLSPVQTSVEHIRDANSRRRGCQSLQTDCLERAFWVQRDDTDSLVFASDGL